MHNHGTPTVDVHALDLAANVRVVEEVFLLLQATDLTHCEGDEDALRTRAGDTLAWLMGQVNLGAHRVGVDMNDLPYDDGDVTSARCGHLTRRFEDGLS
jgi:hypothetical protein